MVKPIIIDLILLHGCSNICAVLIKDTMDNTFFVYFLLSIVIDVWRGWMM